MLIKTLFVFTLVSIVFCFRVKAKNSFAFADSLKITNCQSVVDTSYIGSFYDRLCITLLGVKKGLNMDIHNPDPKISNLQYKPNTAYSWGVGIDYKWLSLELTTRIKSFLSNIDKKGSTRYSSLRIAHTGKKTWASIMGTYYKGFYIANPTILDEKWFEKYDYYPSRHDISTMMLFADFNYAFNHRRYSHMATLWQLEHQKRSAGTPVTGASFAIFESKGKWSYVPEQLWAIFPAETRYKGSTTINISYKLGYVHTFVFRKNLFLHLGLIPGIALQGKKVSIMDNDATKFDEKITFSYEARMAVGYNGLNYYGGITSSVNEFSDFYAKGGFLSFNYTYFRVYFGRRFKLPFKVPLIDRRTKHKNLPE